jgi:hypothetical protein
LNYCVKENFVKTEAGSRELSDLVSIGPAMLRDFRLLGVTSVAQLAREEPRELYDRLCHITGERQDVCVLDTFKAAVEQARNPNLPPGQRNWWYWSRERKRTSGARRKVKQ